MLHSLAASAGAALYKRAATGDEDGDPKQVSGWFFLIVFLNLLVFLPVILYMGYTLGSLFPVLAIVENTDPPAYDPVSLNEDVADDSPDAPARAVDGPGKPITSSLRAINRLLYSVAGWRANFRGFVPHVAYQFAVTSIAGIFASLPLVPSFVGTLLANLALVQLSTAWVHIVISPPNAAPFWRRLPPLKKTFEATCFPAVIFWLATTVSVQATVLASYLLGLPLYEFKKPGTVPNYDGHVAWKGLVVLMVSVTVAALTVIPAKVLLIRVQASLLPPDEDTIIPFDRSYNSTIEPAVVGGKGYVTMMDAIKTFPRESWVRIYLLQAKIIGAIFVMYLVMAAVVVPQLIFLK